MSKPSPCYSCAHAKEIPGDCHIRCTNPTAKPLRKIWPGCGVFPIMFDPNTVFECGGFAERVTSIKGRKSA